MKKMLVVGGAGYIGGCLTDLYKKGGKYDVTVYDNVLYEDRYLKDVHFIYGDVRDTKLLNGIINNYDIVIWLAAIVGDGACAIDTTLTDEINFKSVKWLVDTYDKGTIVFMSTCSVYGVNNDLIDEDAKPNPLSAYAATKLEAEQYVITNAKDYLIFRLGTLYGLGDVHSRLRFDLVVNYLTLRAVRGEQLTVFGGQQWRPILHVRDVAYAVEYCLDNNIKGMYNLSERNVEISELAQTIADKIPGTQIIHQDAKFEDLRNYKVKNDRITSKGWKPRLSLEDGIEEMAKVFYEKRIKNTYDPVYSNVDYLKSIKFGG
jgi:nucleoside-diphosphate-sugar epimerase